MIRNVANIGAIKSDSFPIGTIIDFYGTSQPDGWLICDGRKVPSYMTELRELIGNVTPDLRGLFRRMIGGNSSEIGIKQEDAIRNIRGSIQNLYAEFELNGSQTHGCFTVFENAGTKYHSEAWTYDDYRGGFIFDASLVVPTAPENRPVNMAFNAIIYGGEKKKKLKSFLLSFLEVFAYVNAS